MLSMLLLMMGSVRFRSLGLTDRYNRSRGWAISNGDLKELGYSTGNFFRDGRIVLVAVWLVVGGREWNWEEMDRDRSPDSVGFCSVYAV